MISFESVAYGGWDRCIRLSNGVVDLIITQQMGPRIIRFGFVDKANMFAEVAAEMGQTGGDTWRLTGGHRLWHAPEIKPRTYYPDNQPVDVVRLDDVVRIIQATETTSGIQKEIDLHLSPDKASVQVVHRLKNHGSWAVKLAPWGLSVMAPGGTAIMPQPARGDHSTHLLPTHNLTLWAYTDMSDPRWTWGREFILLRQDAQAETPQKIGAQLTDGWLAYVNGGHMFVKQFDLHPGSNYPDMNANAELFTNHFMLEVESLAPLSELAPGASVEHRETWHLVDNVKAPGTEAEVHQQVLPRLPF